MREAAEEGDAGDRGQPEPLISSYFLSFLLEKGVR